MLKLGGLSPANGLRECRTAAFVIGTNQKCQSITLAPGDPKGKADIGTHVPGGSGDPTEQADFSFNMKAGKPPKAAESR